MKFGAIVKKSRFIVLAMLSVFVLSFGAGFIAGKLKLADVNKLRASKLSEFNRNLEYKVPGYGGLLQSYKNWERQKLMGYILGMSVR